MPSFSVSFQTCTHSLPSPCPNHQQFVMKIYDINICPPHTRSLKQSMGLNNEWLPYTSSPFFLPKPSLSSPTNYKPVVSVCWDTKWFSIKACSLVNRAPGQWGKKIMSFAWKIARYNLIYQSVMTYPSWLWRRIFGSDGGCSNYFHHRNQFNVNSNLWN